MSTEFRKVALKQFAQTQERETPEARYWRKFKHPIVEQQAGHVTNIDFSPVEPHDYAVTCSTRICIYSGKTNKIKKTISRFSDVAYSGTFRNDGKLMVAGGEKPEVKVFDLGSRVILRLMKGHTGPVRVTKWGFDNVSILSCSDDKSVKLWDLPTGKCVRTIVSHQDYVRAACPSQSDINTWITGSYDHTVKLWDVRSDSTSPMRTFDHGAPVESCVILPGGSLVCTAGGNTVKVWDILGTGDLVASFSSHQKTITKVAVDGTGSRLITSGLDGHVKIYDIRNYEVTHGIKHASPVLAFGVSPLNSHLVVGTADNLLTIRPRVVKNAEVQEHRTQDTLLRGGTYRFFLRGKSSAPSADDFKVETQRKARLRPYEQALKKFRYQEALDAALQTRQPVVVVSLLEELVYRNGLKIALSGRDEVSLEPLLSFLIKYITNPRFSVLLMTVCSQVLDIYSKVVGQSVVIDELFFKLQSRLKQEIKFQKQMLGLLGMLDTVMASASPSVVADTSEDLAGESVGTFA